MFSFVLEPVEVWHRSWNLSEKATQVFKTKWNFWLVLEPVRKVRLWWWNMSERFDLGAGTCQRSPIFVMKYVGNVRHAYWGQIPSAWLFALASFGLTFCCSVVRFYYIYILEQFVKHTWRQLSKYGICNNNDELYFLSIINIQIEKQLLY